MHVTIRPARRRDMPAILDLLRQTLADRELGELTCYARDRRQGGLVAEAAGAVVGVAVTTPRPAAGSLRLEAVCVAEIRRGLGLGRRLLTAVEGRASVLGLARVGLATRRDNIAARRLFESVGYTWSAGEVPEEVHYGRAVPELPGRRRVRREGTRPRSRPSLLDRIAWRVLVPAEQRRPAEALPLAPVVDDHGLATSSLFRPEVIRELLGRVPREAVEIRTATGVVPRQSDRVHDLSPVEALDALARRPLWINVHHVERYDSSFARLLSRRRAELGRRWPALARRSSGAGCHLLLASPQASVHFHADPDHNVLHQIRGSRSVITYPCATLPESQRELLAATGDLSRTRRTSAAERLARPAVLLGPGQAIHLPVFTPHRVLVSDEVSISLSVGSVTDDARRLHRVQAIDHRLRGMGVPVSRVSAHPLTDHAWLAFSGLRRRTS